jgi:1-phosphatidylinositol phosphodiesterase
MKNKTVAIVIASAISLFAIVSSLLSFAPSAKTAGTSASQEWMKDVSDDESLTLMRFPGSHDSGASKSLADIAGVCQDASIEDQLNMGVRYLDIRLFAYHNYLTVCHGSINQDLSFSQVVETNVSFLKAHPSETVLLSVKEEQKPVSSSSSFEELLKSQIQAESSYFYTDRFLPSSLKYARGKMILLSRYEGNTIGVDSYQGWGDPKEAESSNTFSINNGYDMEIQDHYKLKDFTTKKEEFISLLDKSKSYISVQSLKETLFINFSSGYLVNSFPPSYSVSIAKDMNNWLASDLSGYTFCGVIVMDFVTPKLAEAVYGGQNK